MLLKIVAFNLQFALLGLALAGGENMLSKNSAVNDTNSFNYQESLEFYMSKIQVIRDGIYYLSSAVKIAPKVYLTAAHSVDKASEIYIEGVKATSWIKHPFYNPKKSNFIGDLAIVFLESDTQAFPAKIGAKYNRQNGFLRAGFGLREKENVFKVFPIEVKASSILGVDQYYDETSTIGDSGGGVFTINDGELFLVGIHSTKEFNKRSYIYTTNINFYLSWVNKELVNHSPPYTNRFYQLQ